MNDDKERNRIANKMLYSFMAIGVIPLVVIFFIYLHNPASPLLHSIVDKTNDLPAVMSAYNPLMTKVMDVYCKSAPFFALVLFAFSIHRRRVINTVNRGALARACFFSPFFYAFFIYMFLFRSLELTTAGRPARLMSGHDVSLLIFYIFLYLILFFLTYGMCYIPVISYKLFKERR